MQNTSSGSKEKVDASMSPPESGSAKTIVQRAKIVVDPSKKEELQEKYNKSAINYIQNNLSEFGLGPNYKITSSAPFGPGSFVFTAAVPGRDQVYNKAIILSTEQINKLAVNHFKQTLQKDRAAEEKVSVTEMNTPKISR